MPTLTEQLEAQRKINARIAEEKENAKKPVRTRKKREVKQDAVESTESED